MCKRVTCLGCLALASAVLNAAININVEGIQKSVVFLYAAGPNGDVDASKPVGTGFWVQAPVKGKAASAYTFLITARHIFDPEWAKCEQPSLNLKPTPTPNPSVIYARLNKKNYNPESGDIGVQFVRLDLVLGNRLQLWAHHADDHIDAAVLPFNGNPADYDARTVPVAMFPTPQEAAAESIGDPIMSAGLMPALSGRRRNLPIFKFGQISNISQEDVETSCGQGPPFTVRVWMIAANLVPGNSGSPIFHVPPGSSGVNIGGTRPMLLGVQSISFLGADVAGMTPITYVYDILNRIKTEDADLTRGPK